MKNYYLFFFKKRIALQIRSIKPLIIILFSNSKEQNSKVTPCFLQPHAEPSPHEFPLHLRKSPEWYSEVSEPWLHKYNQFATLLRLGGSKRKLEIYIYSSFTYCPQMTKQEKRLYYYYLCYYYSISFFPYFWC